jgi:lysophospholipase L1-like esterase
MPRSFFFSGSRAMRNGTAAAEYETVPKLSLKSGLVVVGYLFHLVVPALLLADIFTAQLRGKIVLTPFSPEAAVAGISVLWLFAGLGFFFLSQDRQDFVRRVYKPLFSVYCVYLALILMEVLLHLVLPTPPIPGVDLAWRRVHTKIDPAIYPGVSGTKTYTTNGLGLRGPLPPKDGQAYKIMAIGGSTTLCAHLDDSEVWTQLLMDYMNASQNIQSVWVGNAGVPGFTTVHHKAQMQSLPGILTVDMVVFLIGVNDLETSLLHGGAPTQALLERVAWKYQYPLFRRLRIFLLIFTAAHNLRPRFRHSLRLPDLVTLRKWRAASPVIPLPDMSTAIREYRARVLSLASQCQDTKLRCLFLTQPSLWRNDLRPDERRLLWTGYSGELHNPKAYYSAGALARAMEMYNRALLDVCQLKGLECYDLASHIPKDTSAFFDDMHLNEAGARLMAEILKQYLLSKPPFGGQVGCNPALNEH